MQPTISLDSSDLKDFLNFANRNAVATFLHAEQGT